MPDVDLEIVDHHTEAGRARLRGLAERGFRADDAPFVAGRRELLELVGHFASLRAKLDLPKSGPLDRARFAAAIERVVVAAGGIERDAAASLLRATPLVADLAALIDDTEVYARDADEVERESRHVADEHDRSVYHYVGPHAHRVLARTRLLGLVPFAAVDALRRMRLRGMGASVAASTYDVLVALGAEDLVFADAGTLDPSNAARMPGGTGDFRNCGKPKAHVLARMLKGRNPYARIVGIPGRVVFAEAARTGPDDVVFDQFVADADVVIEVVDDVAAKFHARRRLDESFPDKLLGFIADLGSDPFSALERPRDKRYFHKDLSPDELARMARVGQQATPAEHRREALRAVYRMVEGDIPPDFLLEFVLASLEIVPYWSQTPMAARESGAIFAKLVALQAHGVDVTGENVHISKAPLTLSRPFRAEDVATLRRLCAQVFSAPPR